MGRAKAILLVAALLSGCSQPARIVVGSKNFTEQILLGEIIAQQLERRLQVPVERKLNLGGTLLAHEALRTGAIDLYPEYTGTALTAVLKQSARNPGQVLQVVTSEYQKRWELRWLPPLGFENTFAMVVRNQHSGVRTLSEAAQASNPWRLGVGFEFRQRPDGLPGLRRAYPLKIAGEPVSMDLGLLYSALQNDKVDMIAANSTDGLLSVLPVKALDDDRKYFPPYECAIVVREEALKRHAGFEQALLELSGRLSLETMRKLNHAIDGEHQRVEDVAAQALQAVPPLR